MSKWSIESVGFAEIFLAISINIGTGFHPHSENNFSDFKIKKSGKTFTFGISLRDFRDGIYHTWKLRIELGIIGIQEQWDNVNDFYIFVYLKSIIPFRNFRRSDWH